jgi:lysozyme
MADIDRAIHLAEELATPFEGLHRIGMDGMIYPYHDPVGFPTIGYGHLLSRVKWEALSKYHAITREEASEFLRSDILKAARGVRRLISAPLTDEQFAALIDFSFNVGTGNLEISTLRRLVNRQEYEAAAEQFPRWVYAAGVKLPGLVRRRAAERALFLAGT